MRRSPITYGGGGGGGVNGKKKNHDNSQGEGGEEEDREYTGDDSIYTTLAEEGTSTHPEEKEEQVDDEQKEGEHVVYEEMNTSVPTSSSSSNKKRQKRRKKKKKEEEEETNGESLTVEDDNEEKEQDTDGTSVSGGGGGVGDGKTSRKGTKSSGSIIRGKRITYTFRRPSPRLTTPTLILPSTPTPTTTTMTTTTTDATASSSSTSTATSVGLTVQSVDFRMMIGDYNDHTDYRWLLAQDRTRSVLYTTVARLMRIEAEVEGTRDLHFFDGVSMAILVCPTTPSRSDLVGEAAPVGTFATAGVSSNELIAGEYYEIFYRRGGMDHTSLFVLALRTIDSDLDHLLCWMLRIIRDTEQRRKIRLQEDTGTVGTTHLTLTEQTWLRKPLSVV